MREVVVTRVCDAELSFSQRVGWPRESEQPSSQDEQARALQLGGFSRSGPGELYDARAACTGSRVPRELDSSFVLARCATPLTSDSRTLRLCFVSRGEVREGLGGQ